MNDQVANEKKFRQKAILLFANDKFIFSCFNKYINNIEMSTFASRIFYSPARLKFFSGFSDVELFPFFKRVVN